MIGWILRPLRRRPIDDDVRAAIHRWVRQRVGEREFHYLVTLGAKSSIVEPLISPAGRGINSPPRIDLGGIPRIREPLAVVKTGTSSGGDNVPILCVAAEFDPKDIEEAIDALRLDGYGDQPREQAN